jgi:hypothetical protein
MARTKVGATLCVAHLALSWVEVTYSDWFDFLAQERQRDKVMFQRREYVAKSLV